MPHQQFSTIAYVSNESGNFEIYVMNPDGGGLDSAQVHLLLGKADEFDAIDVL